jgi:hypothetical protein
MATGENASLFHPFFALSSLSFSQTKGSPQPWMGSD